MQYENMNSLSRNSTGCIDLLQVDLNGFPSKRSKSKTMDNIKPRDKLYENLRLSFNNPKRKVQCDLRIVSRELAKRTDIPTLVSHGRHGAKFYTEVTKERMAL